MTIRPPKGRTILLASLIMLGSSLSSVRAELIAASSEDSSTIIQRFPSPSGALAIEIRCELERDKSAIRLIRLRDARLLSSVSLNKRNVRGLQVIWSPDGQFAALFFKSGDAGLDGLRFVAIRAQRLVELKGPQNLHILALLPKADPARRLPVTFEGIQPVGWTNEHTLKSEVSAAARLFETPNADAGYLLISYDVTLECGDADREVKILKSEQTEYANSDEPSFGPIGGLMSTDEGRLDRLKRAAAAGYPNAQVNLGFMFETGDGVAQDYGKAVELYRRAAEQGYAPGGAYLARMYGSARGVPTDYDRATELFRKSIALNDTVALNEFAWFLATCGDDSRRDGEQAIVFARQACDLSHWMSRNFIDTLAAAYAEIGDFDHAVTYQRDAMALPGDYPPDGRMAESLALYQDRIPYRDTDSGHRK